MLLHLPQRLVLLSPLPSYSPPNPPYTPTPLGQFLFLFPFFLSSKPNSSFGPAPNEQESTLSVYSDTSIFITSLLRARVPLFVYKRIGERIGLESFGSTTFHLIVLLCSDSGAWLDVHILHTPPSDRYTILLYYTLY